MIAKNLRNPPAAWNVVPAGGTERLSVEIHRLTLPETLPETLWETLRDERKYYLRSSSLNLISFGSDNFNSLILPPLIWRARVTLIVKRMLCWGSFWLSICLMNARQRENLSRRQFHRDASTSDLCASWVLRNSPMWGRLNLEWISFQNWIFKIAKSESFENLFICLHVWRLLWGSSEVLRRIIWVGPRHSTVLERSICLDWAQQRLIFSQNRWH